MIASDVLQRFHRVRLLIYSVLAVSYMLVFFHRIPPPPAMQFPAGVLADTLGVRRAGSAGALLAGVGSIVFALAPSFTVATIGRFLVGLGVSVVFVGFMRVNADWWSERRYGFISGMTVFLGNVGAILAASPLAALLGYASWRTIFIVIGMLSIVIAAFTYLFVRDRPEDMGFPSLREMEGQAAHAPRSQHWWRDLLEVLGNREIWPGFFASAGLGGGALALVGVWGGALLTDVHGLPRGEG